MPEAAKTFYRSKKNVELVRAFEKSVARREYVAPNVSVLYLLA